MTIRLYNQKNYTYSYQNYLPCNNVAKVNQLKFFEQVKFIALLLVRPIYGIPFLNDVVIR